MLRFTRGKQSILNVEGSSGQSKVSPEAGLSASQHGHLPAQTVSDDSIVDSTPRTIRLSRRKKAFYRRFFFWLLVLLGATSGGVLYAADSYRRELEASLPNPQDALTYVRNGSLVIKAADGAVLQQMGPATREKVKLKDIPTQISQAFIASEDRRFYQHEGVDYQSIVRAVTVNVEAGEVVEGASTITQQLARIVFLDQSATLERKLREALLARKMERELGKDRILERYLNLVYLGSGAYGVADAAWIYFGKSLNELTLPEAAMIAGLAPAPSTYSPLVKPDLALQRRNLVLDRMVLSGYISAAEAEGAQAKPLGLNPKLPRNFYSSAPYFTTYVREKLPERVPADALEYGGLIVETTLNPQWQKHAERVVKEAVEIDGAGQGFEQASLVAIDPRNGEVKALVGGAKWTLEDQFNRATQALRQPGSTFKTFVYTAGVEAGFSPQRTYVDAKFVVDGYAPQNANRKHIGTISIADALTYSVNVVAVKALLDIGYEPIIETAKAMGIQSDLRPTYSLALGASEVTLLELTSAYGTLAAKGKHVPVRVIRRVTNHKGQVIFDAAKLPTSQAVSESTAAIMTWVLQKVVRQGTGVLAYLPDRPVAGKTGTTENARDLWFVGYVPQLVTGVWLGNDDYYPTWSSSATAAFTWKQFMAQATQDFSPEPFPGLPPDHKGRIQAKPVKPGSQRTVATKEDNKPNQAATNGIERNSVEPTVSEPNYPSAGSSDGLPEPYQPRTDAIAAEEPSLPLDAPVIDAPLIDAPIVDEPISAPVDVVEPPLDVAPVSTPESE